MNRIYKKLVAYNPATNTVSCIKMLDWEVAIDRKASDEAFFEVFYTIDRVRELVIGVGMDGDIYQLSPAPYGTYIKENATTVRNLNKGKFLCAMDKYHAENKLPYDIY